MAARDLSLAALFVGLGVLVPILFHAVGLGSVFLPMFLPLAAAGFYLPLGVAMAVGVLTPVVSALGTGMPPLSPPVAQLMALEGLALTGVVGWLARKKGVPVFVALVAGLAASRAVMVVWVTALVPLLGLPARSMSLAALLQGVPGLVLILVVVPIVVKRLPPSQVRKGITHA
ncbi:MAG: ECF transporter S component [Calditrichaeota bacterium]|nr:ECF transporter S component [Calditrichota bacterium]